ncbi:MAG: hypothetical protein JWR24_228 [Actinoallomurus sp.]|jgi:hypothetical protein|nr:hypothetical protein [Actinoallomurus sp.]
MHGDRVLIARAVLAGVVIDSLFEKWPGFS